MSLVLASNGDVDVTAQAAPVLPSNAADLNSTNLDTIIAQMSDWNNLVFPPMGSAGQTTYNFSRKADFGARRRVSIRGPGTRWRGALVTLQGNFSDPLLYRNGYAAGVDACVYMEGLALFNGSGPCAQFEYVNGLVVEKVSLAGWGGWITGAVGPTGGGNPCNTDLHFKQVQLNGNANQYPNAIGLQVYGIGDIDVDDSTGWGEAIRVCNNVSVRGHLEVNGIGLKIGVDPNGMVKGNSGTYGPFDLEGNLTDILVVNGQGVIQGYNVLGEFQTKPGQSQVGLDIQGANDLVVMGGNFGGSYSVAAVRMVTGGSLTFIGTRPTNSIGPKWVYSGPGTGLTTIGTNCPLIPGALFQTNPL